MAPDDSALIERWVRDRDADAFAEIATRYAGMVYAACRRTLGNASEAQDVAQECFLTLVQTRVPPQTNLAAWLHRVAVNKARDHMKHGARRRERETRFAQGRPSTTEVAWSDLEGYIDEAIAELPDELRTPIIAHFLGGATHAAIAETLGMSRQTVTYRLGKGVELIRESLRSRGVQVAVAALTTLLAANAAEAAPAPLIGAIGKMAVSGVRSAVTAGQPVGTLAALLTAKSAAVGAAILVVAVVALIAVRKTSEAPPIPLADAPPVSQAVDEASTERASLDIDDGSVEESSRLAEGEDGAAGPSSGEQDNWRVLTGVVVDASGKPIVIPPDTQGNPVPSRVHVDSRGRNKGRGYSVGSITRGDGTFVIDRYEPNSSGVIWACEQEANLASEFMPFALTPEGPHHVVLTLMPGARISGAFVDADGLAIPDAGVYASSTDDAQRRFSGVVDQHGRFEIGPLPPGSYMVRPRDTREGGMPPGYGPVSATVELHRGQHLAGVRLVFPKHQDVIAGRVLDESGRPVANAEVSASAQAGPGHSTAYSLWHASAETAGRGAFKIPLYGPDAYRLDVMGLCPARSELLVVEAGERDVEIVVKNFVRLRGRVVHADSGEPIDEFTVSLTPAGADSPRRSGTYADEAGAFELDYTGSGDVVIAVQAPGLGSTEQRVRLRGTSADLTFRIGSSEAVRGRVVDANGRGVAGAYFVESRPFVPDVRYVEHEALGKSGDDGVFSLMGLRPSAEGVFVLHERFPFVEARVERGGEWIIVLPEGAAVQGRVTLGGRPQSERHVTLHLSLEDGARGHLHRDTTTDSDGRYRFTGLPAGEASIQATATSSSAESARTGERCVTLSEEQTAVVDFEFKAPNAALSGRVLVGGEPARAQVNVTSPSEEGVPEGHLVNTESDGVFHFDGLLAGPAEVRTRLSGAVPRDKRQYIELLADKVTEADVRFVPGTAAMEGAVTPNTQDSGKVTLIADIDTSLGREHIDMSELRVTDGVYSLEGLPAGQAAIRLEWRRKDHSLLVRIYDVSLLDNVAVRRDISFEGSTLHLNVTGAAPDEQVWICVYPGDQTPPDYRAMTINEMEQYIAEHPPIVMSAGVAGILDGIEAGACTVVVIAPGSQIRGEDHVIPGLRYAWRVVEVSDAGDTSVDLSLR